MILLDSLGKRWALRILWELRDSRLSFRDLRSRCDDMSPTSLNLRLKELAALEFVDHDGVGYGLTSWGQELGERLIDLDQWARKWDRARE